MCRCCQRRIPKNRINHHHRLRQIARPIGKIVPSLLQRTENRPLMCLPNKIRYTRLRANICWQCSETHRYTNKTKSIIKSNLESATMAMTILGLWTYTATFEKELFHSPGMTIYYFYCWMWMEESPARTFYTNLHVFTYFIYVCTTNGTSHHRFISNAFEKKTCQTQCTINIRLTHFLSRSFIFHAEKKEIKISRKCVREYKSRVAFRKEFNCKEGSTAPNLIFSLDHCRTETAR